MSPPKCFRKTYEDVFHGDERWRVAAGSGKGETFAWDSASTYVRHPPYFENMPLQPPEVADMCAARARC
jgi:aconitate hydratase